MADDHPEQALAVLGLIGGDAVHEVAYFLGGVLLILLGQCGPLRRFGFQRHNGEILEDTVGLDAVGQLLQIAQILTGVIRVREQPIHGQQHQGAGVPLDDHRLHVLGRSRGGRVGQHAWRRHPRLPLGLHRFCLILDFRARTGVALVVATLPLMKLVLANFLALGLQRTAVIDFFLHWLAPFICHIKIG